ncbi:hypothetical protein GCM10008965_44310 [Methylorubrum aminovorans]
MERPAPAAAGTRQEPGRSQTKGREPGEVPQGRAAARSPRRLHGSCFFGRSIPISGMYKRLSQNSRCAVLARVTTVRDRESCEAL